MSDLKIYTTLKRKDDASVEVYPNINPEYNIPDTTIDGVKLKTNTVTTGKIANNAVTALKINEGAVTTPKINDNAVTTPKINNGAITAQKIGDDVIQLSHLYPSLKKSILCLDYVYNIYMGDSDDIQYLLVGTTTLSNVINDYSASDINSALDFDKNQADYTSTDLAILKLIIDGIGHFPKDTTGSINIHTNDFYYYIGHLNNYYTIEIDDWLGNTLFELRFDGDTNTILNYTNVKYIYIDLISVINKNVGFED